MGKHVEYSSRKPSVLLTFHFFLKYLANLTIRRKNPGQTPCAFLIKEVLMKPSIFRTRERKSQSFRTRGKNYYCP